MDFKLENTVSSSGCIISETISIPKVLRKRSEQVVGQGAWPKYLHLFTEPSINKISVGYDIKERIGEGAFARVRAVEAKKCKGSRGSGTQMAPKKKLVVKQFDQAKLSKEDYHAAKVEAALLFELNHKNIIGFHDYYLTARDTHIVLERKDMNLR